MILDLTNNNWKHQKQWNYVNHNITTRKWKRVVLIPTIIFIGACVVTPFTNFMILPALKILGRFG